MVVITGASRGIGRAIALAMAERGARIGLLSRSRDDLEAVERELAGVTTVALAVADVGDPDQLRAGLAELEGELGPIDVLVANAGIGAYGAFVDLDDEEIERVLRVNVLGTVHTIRAVAPGMVARRSGHIVVIGSIAGRIGSPFEAIYAASKFAGVGLTEALSVELHPYGVGVSMVNPGPVDTGFGEARGHPYDRERPRPIPTDVVAAAVLDCIDHGRLERTVPRSLAAAVVVRHLVPPLFRWGSRRAMRRELAADATRR